MIASGVTVGRGRYYLKERSYHGTLVQDEEADRIVKESRLWEAIYNLKAMQVADEITHQVCVRIEREREGEGEGERERERDRDRNRNRNRDRERYIICYLLLGFYCVQ